MNYTKIQKFTSSLVLFIFFFWQIFWLSFFSLLSQVSADNKKFHELVSVIVEQSVYDKLNSKIERYAQDIQNTLENTRVIIFPIDKKTSSISIASMNESLFNEWYKSIDNVNFESKLIWTIFIGDFNLAIVWENWERMKSMIPYVDFEDKRFVYDFNTKVFERNKSNVDWLKVEIWHGVISPNSWNASVDLKQISNFLDKDHDFYTWKNNFKNNEGVLNWNKNDKLDTNYKPYVFYMDLIREQQGLSYSSYKWYELGQKNKSELLNNQYSQELAKKAIDQVIWAQNEELEGILWSIDDADIRNAFNDFSWPWLWSESAIMTKSIIDWAVNNFLEIFNKWTISDFRTNVHNAWRYSEWTSVVNVDMIPYLVSVLDVVTDNVVKTANDELEDAIDWSCKWMMRCVAIPTKIIDRKTTKIYENFLYWKKAEEIKKIKECTIYRGSPRDWWTLVEANRTYNLNNSEKDRNRLKKKKKCIKGVESWASLEWCWWRNSPLHLTVTNGNMTHKYPNKVKFKNAVEPLFDIWWSKKVVQDGKLPTPVFDLWLGPKKMDDWGWKPVCCNPKKRAPIFEDCMAKNFIEKEKRCCLKPVKHYKGDSYSLCEAQNICKGQSEEQAKEEASKKNKDKVNTLNEDDENEEEEQKICVFINGKQIGDYKCKDIDIEHHFKKMPSAMEHKSPTDEELNGIVDALSTPSIPIDKKRYLDWLSIWGEYLKIEYPSLCNIWKWCTSSKDAKSRLEKSLNEKSDSINKKIKKYDPEKLSDEEKKEIEDLPRDEFDLKYPDANIDLLSEIKWRPDVKLQLPSWEKVISYYDFLAFSIYWNNIWNISSKYKFVLEHYLSDQNWWNELRFILPKSKPLYEVAYLWAYWDAQNMYIKMDIEAKKEANNLPYQDINSRNSLLDTNKLSLWVINADTPAVGGACTSPWKVPSEEDITEKEAEWGEFKCSPPWWVPIWEWFPAVMCRLEWMLPPEVIIWEWECSFGSSFEAEWYENFESNQSFLPKELEKDSNKGCSGIPESSWSFKNKTTYLKYVQDEKNICINDFNKNWINDCIENKLEDWGKLILFSTKSRYYLNESWNLKTKLFDKNNKRITIDDSSYIKYDLKKIIDKDTKKIIFDNSKQNFDDNLDLIKEYVFFNPYSIKSFHGVSSYMFSTKNKNADIYFEANLILKDWDLKEKINIKSNSVLVKIRSDRLFLKSYKKDSSGEILLSKRTVRANDLANIYLLDGYTNIDRNIKNIEKSINNSSIVLELLNLWSDWKSRKINFPINASLKDSTWKVLVTEKINNLNWLKELYKITKTWAYTITFIDKYDYSVSYKIDVLAWKVDNVKIDLWTTVLGVGWNISTNLVSIYDRFNNIVVWETYKYDLNILWNSLEFESNNDNNIIFSSFEWFKAFRLKTLNKVGNSKIRIDLYKGDNKILSSSKNLNVIESIKINTKFSDVLKVWKNKYSVEIEVNDMNNKLLSDFNSRIYLVVDNNYIKIKDGFSEIKWWKAKIDFSTKIIAAQDLELIFKVEWFSDELIKYIDILPSNPMWLSVFTTWVKIEASKESESYVTIELRDIYNNIIFNDNETDISLEILDRYKEIINSNDKKKTLKNWIAKFKISATEHPWTAYLKFTSSKKLEDNLFNIFGGWKYVQIPGVSEKVLKIETFYFYNAKNILWKKYNSLYTTLLWSNYWDFTQRDYLAGWLLFDKDNKSLAVTSLLNNPYNFKSLININYDGVIFKSYEKSTNSDLSQDLVIKIKKDSKWHYYLDLFNRALSIYIWKIYLNFDDLNLSNEFYEELLSSDSIDLKKIINVSNFSIHQTKNKLLLENLLKTKKNSLIISLETGAYWVNNLYSEKWDSVSIYYKDPFSTEFSLNSFSRSNLYTYDYYQKNSWLWWKAWNKTLLDFAAWQNVWDSTKDYMWVSIVNLWDPVISIKKIQLESHWINKNFDRTIWKKINVDELSWYKLFDYNWDNKTDILLFKEWNTFSLLENKDISSSFLNQKDLVKIVDLWNIENVNVWDFTGDRYDDIFFVNNKWKPFILNNNNKDFIRIDLSEKFDLKWKIIKAKTFDMDSDRITDIITLDETWEVNIFYWKKTGLNFDKKTIYSGYGIKLNDKIRTDFWAVYFDWLTQLKSRKEKIEKFTKESAKDFTKKTLKNKGKNNNVEDSIPEDLLDNMLFSQVNYSINGDKTKNENNITTFIKSEFVSKVGFSVNKTFKDINKWSLQSWDNVLVEVKLKNISKKELKNIAYLEWIPKYFNIDYDSISVTDWIEIKPGLSSYKFLIDWIDLKPLEEIIIKYNLSTKSIKYWYLNVWLHEKGEIWDDKYWDIIVSLSKYNCWWNNDIFKSIWKRSYKKWIQKEKCDESEIPEELVRNNTDKNNDWVPDYIENLQKTNVSCWGWVWSELKWCMSNLLDDYKKDQKVKKCTDICNNAGDEKKSSNKKATTSKKSSKKSKNTRTSSDLNGKIDEATEKLDNFIEWFWCWFWWGSCFGLPINWAPLAPWGDPVVMWKLIWDWLKVDEWIPVFSSLNWTRKSWKCIPWPYPFAIWAPGCSSPWAWWMFWVDSPTNYFRLFVTPTLTGWIWVAACVWATARLAWNIPPIWLSPLIPGWNCVVLAKPLPNMCKDEELLADPESIWPVKMCSAPCMAKDDWNVDLQKSWKHSPFWVINWNCSAEAQNERSKVINKLDDKLVEEYLKYKKDWKITDSLSSWSCSIWKGTNVLNNSLLKLNSKNLKVSEGDIELDYASNGNEFVFKDVEELSQQRVAPFPDFITWWVNDQLEEFITKLVDFPTLFVVLPDFSNLYNADWWKYWDELSSWLSNTTKNAIASWKYASWIKEVYEFLGNVPFVTIESEPVEINIPFANEETINSTLIQRKMALESYEIWGSFDNWMDEVMSRVRANISILESYKEIPALLADLAWKKQEYLEQILCNIEVISEFTGGRISRNWERFKAWVELYILIKAILKSWQLLVDIFIDYDEECHECKNERYDSIWWEFSIISMIMPKIPVIEFPKWPDVVLDLHNIRLNLTIALPEFEFNKRLIILPAAPMSLPTAPSVNMTLPEMPLLPLINIPKLPDIPSLPSVKLPDLPPPPTLPKLLSAIEWFLKILKLITKIMCILKKSPFVPETRAWDQIAYLTEGQGYRPFDFTHLLQPKISYPWVDEIRVTSYVNLEFESEFLVEMAKTLVEPINDIWNNFINIFEVPVKSLDFSDIVPGELNIKVGFNQSKEKLKTIWSKDFLVEVNKELSSEYLMADQRFDKLRTSFDVVNNYTYSKEEKVISDLKKMNYEKFKMVKSILKREIQKQKELQNKLKNWNSKWIYETIANSDNDIEMYNNSLKKYNDAFVESTKRLIDSTYLSEDKLKENWEVLVSNIKRAVSNSSLAQLDINKNLVWIKKYEAKKVFVLDSMNNNSKKSKTCSTKNALYKRDYKWIYIIQEKWNIKINYKLFDYLDDLKWDEKTNWIDFDWDRDVDLLYSIGNNLYLKENLTKTPWEWIHLSWVIVLDSDDNKFVNGDIYYEALNNISEIGVWDRVINLLFDSSKRKDIYNYRLEYYNRIDKYLNEGNDRYFPEGVKKNIIDAFSSSEDETILSKKEWITERSNIAYIYEVWSNISKVNLKTKELINLADSIRKWNVANISNWTKIYAWWSSVKLNYIDWYSEELKSIKIDAYTNISSINFMKIVWISWDAYVSTGKDIILKWNEIYNYFEKPLVFDSKISIYWEFKTNISSHIGIKYYDRTKADLDFRKIESYKIYDLWYKSETNLIHVQVDNDFLYSKIYIFNNNVLWTKSTNILLSPQKEADKYWPEIDFNWSIRIPVYTEKWIDFTDHIYENTWTSNIKDFKIEWIKEDKYELSLVNNKIRVKFGKFNTIFRKTIKIYVSDLNWNTSNKDIKIEVYPPVPHIDWYNDWEIKWLLVNENILEEPINIYRYRWGVVKKLKTFSWSTAVETIKNWSFIFNVNIINSDLLDVLDDGVKIFSINEKTWKIILNMLWYSIKSGLTKDYFTRFDVLNKSSKKVFSQIIKLRDSKISIVKTFENIIDNGIYLNIIDSKFDYYKLPDNIDENPGALVLYRKSDIKKSPLFIILKNWKIKPLSSFYSLEYSTFKDFIVLKLIDKHYDKEIGKILLMINNFYIIK